MSDELYDLARTEGVAIERTDRGLVRLTGPQRLWFLQNTVTADVTDVPAGRWVESCFLEPKGHVIAHFRVGVPRRSDAEAQREEVWLDVDPPAAELVDWFGRYRFRTKVEISDVSAPSVTVLGPPAAALAGPGEIRTSPEGALVFGDRLGELPLAEVHRHDLPPAVASLRRAPDSLYEVFRIEAGVGRFGVDYGPRTLPQEAGLGRLVSVEKGCYVGQEVVARIHFRGHVNRVLRTVTFEEPADAVPGKALQADGSRVGEVTSAVTSPRLGPVGIAMARVEPDDGARLDVEGGGVAVLGPVPEGTKVKARDGS